MNILNKIFLTLFIYLSIISNSNAGSYGKGELKLSYSTVDFFIQYIKGKSDMSPGTFVVTTDGEGAYYWYCSDGVGNCQPGSFKQKELKCEQYWQKECKAFAFQRTIKWKNGINPGKGKASRINSKWSDAEIRDKLRELGFVD